MARRHLVRTRRVPFALAVIVFTLVSCARSVERRYPKKPSPDPSAQSAPETPEGRPVPAVDSGTPSEVAAAYAQTGTDDGRVHGATRRFQRAEDWLDHFEGPGRDEWQRPEEVVRLLQIEPGMKVVDLGAGTGYFLPHLSRAVGETGEVLALDTEQDMVRYMDERAEREDLLNVQARVVPYDDPDLPAGYVDRILVVNTWHHMAHREAYASRLAAALAPGGSVCIVDFTLESPVGPSRSERLAPEEIARELQAAGLETVILPEDLPHQYVVVGRRR